MHETVAGILTGRSRGLAAVAIARKNLSDSLKPKGGHSVHRLSMLRTFIANILIPAITWGAQVRIQPQIDPFNLELRIHELINAERTSRKLRPLKIEDKLSEVARLHSRDMSDRNFFDHINPDRKGPTDRGRARGYTCRKYLGDYIAEGLAENIFQNNLYDRVIFRGDAANYEWKTTEDIAKSTVNGWMVSPGHRQNILTARYEREGIGIYIAPNDQVLITQMFC
jgi:uncharacterized protein YkwD